MKKILLTMAFVAITLAASAFNLAPMPVMNEAQLGEKLNAKKATPEMINRMAEETFASTPEGPRRLKTPVSKASDLTGGYTHYYQMATEPVTDVSTAASTSYTGQLVVYDADDVAGTVKIGGLFDAAITARLDMTSYNYPALVLDDQTDVCHARINVDGTAVDITCNVIGLLYQDNNWYYSDIVAYVRGDQIIWGNNIWITRIISHILTEGDQYNEFLTYRLNPVWMPGATTLPNDELNGVTTYRYDPFNLDLTHPSTITQDDNYNVSVTNFAGLTENPLNIKLQEGRTWTADHPTMFTNGGNTFVFYGLNVTTNTTYLIDAYGTGTNNQLNFGCEWTGYDGNTNYWLNVRHPATITLAQGRFDYPEQFYLLGTFNDWDEENPIAMTKDANGNWTTTLAMEANAEFKLKDISGDWMGAESDGNFIVQKEQVQNGTAISMGYGEGYMNLQIPVAGTWTLTLDPETMKLTIAGEWVDPEQYYLIGSFNDWNTETQLPMTLEDGKWVITQEMEADAEFKFRNEKDEWIGAVSNGNFIVQKEQVENATEITLGYGNEFMNFQIPVAGTWTLTIDPETGKLVIAGEWVEPIVENHVYILGEVGDNGWAPNVGVEMTTEDNNIFTAEVNFKGLNDGYSYFSFTTQLGEDGENWDAIDPYRFGAVSDGDFLVTDEWIGPELTLTYENGQAYQIPGGDYTLTVNLAEMTLVIAKKEVPVLPDGDLNGDGNVDVEDLNLMINVILNDGDTTGITGNADVNGDGICDIEDVNAIINAILAD